MITTISSYSTNYKGTNDKVLRKRSWADRRFERVAVRLVAASLLFVILFTGFTLMKSDASGEHPAEPTAGEKVIFISPGDTLWSIAGGLRKEGQDLRRIIFDLKERNNLSSSTLKAGQILIIPADY